MAKNVCILTFLVILAGALILGCGQQQGKVEQGRAIATDNANKTVTLILDVKHELGKPVYNQVPPVTFAFPDDPHEMGQEPKAGKLMSVNPDKKEIVIYDDATKNFKTIVYVPVEVKKGVGLRDPLVAGKKFPVVDREKKTVTVYDKRNRLVTTFQLPEEYFQMPDNTFGFGDEVRLYAKAPGKAARLMNVSETDIYKK
jgi:hypothetical protein